MAAKMAMAITLPGDVDYPLQTKEGAAGRIEEIRRRFNKGNLYVDPDFPAKDVSVGKVGGDSAAGDGGSFTGALSWVRPHELCDAWKENGLKPNFAIGQQSDCGGAGGACSALDIRQGALGDCGWLTSLGAATSREDLRNIIIPLDNYDGFDDDKYCGAFHFRVYDIFAGKYADIVVDDLIPCNKDLNPVFAKPWTLDAEGKDTVNEYWVPLAEKAYSKYRGSYREMEERSAGRHDFSNLELFTGGFDVGLKCSEYRDKPGGYEELEAKVKYSLDQGHVLILGGQRTEATAEGYDKYGLVAKHAYSVLDGVEVPRKDGHGGKARFLLRVRNPWGNKEWSGPLSDGDDAGWAELEQDLRRRNAQGSASIDEGVFWIDLRDVLKYYDEVEYCTRAEEVVSIRSEWPAPLQAKKLGKSPSVPELLELPAFKFEIKPGTKPSGKDGNGKCSPGLEFVLGEAGVIMDPSPQFRYFIYALKDGDLAASDGAVNLSQVYCRKKVDRGGAYRATVKRVDGIQLEPGVYVLVPVLQTIEDGAIPKAYVGKAIPFMIRFFMDPPAQLEKIN